MVYRPHVASQEKNILQGVYQQSISVQKQLSKQSHARGLHVIALFEGAKGLLVLLVGFELHREKSLPLYESGTLGLKRVHFYHPISFSSGW
jgi:hypothetical protein